MDGWMDGWMDGMKNSQIELTPQSLSWSSVGVGGSSVKEEVLADFLQSCCQLTKPGIHPLHLLHHCLLQIQTDHGGYLFLIPYTFSLLPSLYVPSLL